jgi:hypothetical protein
MAKKKQPTALPEGMEPQKRERKKSHAEPKKAPESAGIHEVTSGVPDNVKIAMANAIMTFSKVEQTLDSAIWIMAGLGYEDGRLLTAAMLDTSDKADVAKKMAKRYGVDLESEKENPRTVWSVLRELIELRNKMAHGVWWMYRLTTPMVSSYRNRASSGELVAEEFSIRRMEGIAKQCEVIQRALDRIAEKAQALRGTRPPPR